MKKQMKTGGIGFYVLILGIIFLAVWVSGSYGGSTGNGYNLASFKDDVMDGKVVSVKILPNEEVPTGEVTVQLKDKQSVSFFVSDVTIVENIVYADDKLAKNCVVRDIQKPSWVFTTLLPYGLVIIGIFLLFSFMSAQSAGAGGGNAKMMNFGKSRAQRIDPGEHSKKFQDVVAGPP